MLVAIAPRSKGAVPTIKPTPQIEMDGLSLLQATDRAAVKAGFGFELSDANTTFNAIDKRDPNSTKSLESILMVDQKAFLQELKTRRSLKSGNINVVKVECYFSEMSDWGYITPSFRVKWTVRETANGPPRILEAFSFGITYNGRVWNNDSVKNLWLRGAAAAYQAATYKVAIALQELLKSGNQQR